MREKKEQLEKEVDRHREKVSALQDRLDSVTKVRNEQTIHKFLPSSEFSSCSLICHTFPLLSRGLT